MNEADQKKSTPKEKMNNIICQEINRLAIKIVNKDAPDNIKDHKSEYMFARHIVRCCLNKCQDITNYKFYLNSTRIKNAICWDIWPFVQAIYGKTKTKTKTSSSNTSTNFKEFGIQ